MLQDFCLQLKRCAHQPSRWKASEASLLCVLQRNGKQREDLETPVCPAKRPKANFHGRGSKAPGMITCSI